SNVYKQISVHRGAITDRRCEEPPAGLASLPLTEHANMPDRRIEFEVYRLNVVDDEELLPIMGRRISIDQDILNIVEFATSADLDDGSKRDRASSAQKRVLPEYVEVDNEGIPAAPIAGVKYSRATLRQAGTILTDFGLEQGVSTPDQPLATTVQ